MRPLRRATTRVVTWSGPSATSRAKLSIIGRDENFCAARSTNLPNATNRAVCSSHPTHLVGWMSQPNRGRMRSSM